MEDSLSGLSQWSSAIGALAGAVIGFSGAFLLALYNKRTDREEAAEERRRVNRERLFLAVSSMIHAAREASRIYAAKLLDPKFQSIYRAPAKEYDDEYKMAEMLTILYFPEYKDDFQGLTAHVGRSNKRSIDVSAIILSRQFSKPTDGVPNIEIPNTGNRALDYQEAMSDDLQKLSAAKVTFLNKLLASSK